jgi:hypothetical protein
MAFNTILGFADQAFSCIVLLLAAGLASHIAYGFGTKKAREMFIALVLLLLVGTQLFHLINAATYIPASRFYTWNTRLHRTDCIESGKGGKRMGKTSLTEDKNPCFCNAETGNVCTIIATGAVVSAGSCPIDGTARCTTKGGDKVHRFVPNLRNCKGGQAAYCTKDQPCYPCEREHLYKWGMGQRCRSCSSQNNGECNFVPGVGPYCFATTSDGSMTKVVEPCKKCCTEPTVLIKDGVCF